MERGGPKSCQAVPPPTTWRLMLATAELAIERPHLSTRSRSTCCVLGWGARMAAVRVRPWLFVGGEASLAQLEALSVTRFISLGAPPAAVPGVPADACLAVPLVDEDHADLLSTLPACVAFAERAAADGASLLIACHAGVSRSAAVACAVLMAREQLAADAALAAVQAAHPAAAPNEGFCTQLQLFGDMRCCLDDEHAPYRRFRVAQLAAAHAAGTARASDASAVLCADPSNVGRDTAGTLRCRMCRRLVAAGEHIVAHERGAGAGAFDPRKRGKVTHVSGACSSIFVEPLAWMAPALEDMAVEGKLMCPKCAGRLGGFCWAGAQCSCGAWVVPAFQLHAARVDVTR